MRTYAAIHKSSRAGTPRRVRGSLPSIRPASVAGRVEIRRILHGPRLQAKLTVVGAPDDAYEREADRVADEVVRIPETAVFLGAGSGAGQELSAEGGGARREPVSEHEERQTLRLQQEEREESLAPPPLTFDVAETNLEPKSWGARGNVNAGADATRTDITIGGPPNSTIDVEHCRQATPEFGHTHTNDPVGRMATRFKHGHLTNRAGGQGRVFNDFQIDSRGNNRTITYHAPHAAGEVLLTAQIRGRADAAASREVAVTTQVEGLQEYMTDHPNEILVGQVENHGTNHWGTAEAINRMHNIVDTFRESWVQAAPAGTERDRDDAPTIRINDFNLEHGGLYDFRDNWRNPHRTHRLGNDIDISRSVLINGNRTWLRPGQDQVGEVYRILNNAIGVNPEDARHWHVAV